MRGKPKFVYIENAKIPPRFRNFSGEEGLYNREGDTFFSILLDDETADLLASEGWNVKTLKPREDEEVGTPIIHVKVSFEPIPPKIVLISSAGKTFLDREGMSVLDYSEISNFDVALAPYQWEVNGKTGIKAYLKSMYATLDEDQFDRKYADV